MPTTMCADAYIFIKNYYCDTQSSFVMPICVTMMS